MLREIFPRGYAAYEQSRFAEELEDFGVWLKATGYSRGCARGHLFRLKHSLERMVRSKPCSAYTVAQLEMAFGEDNNAARRLILFRATQRAYQSFLSSGGRLTVTPIDVPFVELRHRYRQDLTELRGLSSGTIKQHESTISDFLTRTLPEGKNLGCLTHAHIERYLALKSKDVGRHRLRHVVAHLRSFLGFCHARNEIDAPMDVIDSPRAHADEVPPRALAWPLVQALLRSVDHSSRSGWRDYTILHLMAHYGLRPCEIVSLRLDSIDWSAKTLKVEQCKTRSTLVLPLIDRTILILHRYLRRGRSCSSHPQLFLRARCPTGELTRHAVADIFEKRSAQSGLPIHGYSAYSLRHAFAMRLLKRGVGLKAIGDLLGHRNLASTCYYLRLDIDMLREVALPVPTRVHG
jgi:integrase/recombinase XerD